MNVIISSIHDSGGGIRVFELRAPAGQSLPAYQAGAHIDVTLGNGLVRQYSLCCIQPGPDNYRIAVKLDPQSRGGSSWLHRQTQVGDTIRIGTPRDAFGLAANADQHLLMAGGIGITPILSMAYALLQRGANFTLDYFVRDAASIAFAAELAALPLAAHVRIHVGLSPQQSATAIDAAMVAGVGNAHVYSCGPGPFMTTVAELGAARLGMAAVHQESFGASAAAVGDVAFVVRLKNGKEVMIAADRTVLSCLQEAGVTVPCSCEVGVCGSCQTSVLDGQPEHRDSFLSDAEKASNRCFMPCVSRARSSLLILDL